MESGYWKGVSVIDVVGSDLLNAEGKGLGEWVGRFH